MSDYVHPATIWARIRTKVLNPSPTRDQIVAYLDQFSFAWSASNYVVASATGFKTVPGNYKYPEGYEGVAYRLIPVLIEHNQAKEVGACFIDHLGNAHMWVGTVNGDSESLAELFDGWMTGKLLCVSLRHTTTYGNSPTFFARIDSPLEISFTSNPYRDPRATEVPAYYRDRVLNSKSVGDANKHAKNACRVDACFSEQGPVSVTREELQTIAGETIPNLRTKLMASAEMDETSAAAAPPLADSAEPAPGADATGAEEDPLEKARQEGMSAVNTNTLPSGEADDPESVSKAPTHTPAQTSVLDVVTDMATNMDIDRMLNMRVDGVPVKSLLPKETYDSWRALGSAAKTGSEAIARRRERVDDVVKNFDSELGNLSELNDKYHERTGKPLFSASSMGSMRLLKMWTDKTSKDKDALVGDGQAYRGFKDEVKMYTDNMRALMVNANKLVSQLSGDKTCSEEAGAASSSSAPVRTVGAHSANTSSHAVHDQAIAGMRSEHLKQNPHLNTPPVAPYNPFAYDSRTQAPAQPHPPAQQQQPQQEPAPVQKPRSRLFGDLTVGSIPDAAAPEKSVRLDESATNPTVVDSAHSTTGVGNFDSDMEALKRRRISLAARLDQHVQRGRPIRIGFTKPNNGMGQMEEEEPMSQHIPLGIVEK